MAHILKETFPVVSLFICIFVK